ncbi:MAG TPA: hypothetical protein VL202_23870 [Pararhizobium sp.]|uniref:hypothetical protein n=1 Tax=Pararhizobium sp. TaxID=1977563 RepID=UPI002C62586A|nr:hypothetical protein [Pararhizobium sp.]HTO34183.1 hypothetical protein [Pararhizobium sp.]
MPDTPPGKFLNKETETMHFSGKARDKLKKNWQNRPKIDAFRLFGPVPTSPDAHGACAKKGRWKGAINLYFLLKRGVPNAREF